MTDVGHGQLGTTVRDKGSVCVYALSVDPILTVFLEENYQR